MATIPNGLRLDVFRQRIECKNTLTNKGGMYIGTGLSSGSGDAKVYETTQLVPGEQHTVFGMVAGAENGVGYTTIGTNHFENNAITKAKIAVIADNSIGDSKISGQIASKKITGIKFTVSGSDLTILYD